MADLHGGGHTLLVATHNLETVAGMATRLILMQEGKIVEDGPFTELLNRVEAFGVRMPGASLAKGEVPSWPNP